MAGATFSLSRLTLRQMPCDSQEEKANVVREDGERRKCLGSNGIFEHLNQHLKSPTTKLLVRVGGKLPPSLIPVLEFTVTCSHYHCTWYKIPAPGRLGKSFHPSYKLQRHAAFPHNTFFEH